MEEEIVPEPDFLSSLPDNIIDLIFSHLPISDAVRMRFLSRKWRHRWASMPYLRFQEQLVIASPNDAWKFMGKFVRFIDRCLLLHRGPIQRFELVTKFLQIGSAIDSWMLFLSTNDVKELILFFLDTTKGHYKLPSSVFSFPKLSLLHLQRCIVQPPPSFIGFGNLKILELDDIIFPNEEILENMISNCPVLENLKLLRLKYPNCLKINAHNLSHFHLDGNFEDMSFINVPNLTHVYINLDHITAQQIIPGTCQIIDILGCVVNVEELSMDGYFLLFLAMSGGILWSCQRPVTYHHLKSLSLKLNFEQFIEIWLCITLLEIAPMLKKLEIEAYFVQSTARVYNLSLTERPKLGINVVKIINISGNQNELEFIKYLLSNTPELKVLSIKPKSGNVVRDSMVLKELVRFRRASTSAEIHYNDGL